MTDSPLLLALRVFLAKDEDGSFELRRLRNTLAEIGVYASYKEIRIGLRAMDADLSRRRRADGRRPTLVYGYRIRFEALSELAVAWSRTIEAERKAEAAKFLAKEPPPWQGT